MTDTPEPIGGTVDVFSTIDQQTEPIYDYQMDMDCESMPMAIDKMPIVVDGGDVTGTLTLPFIDFSLFRIVSEL